MESKTKKEFKSEVSDLLYSLYCAIQSKTKISLPVVGAKRTVNKIIFRLEIWRKIFRRNGLAFDKKYLVNGSNYNRPEKVQKALQLAKQEQKRG